MTDQELKELVASLAVAQKETGRKHIKRRQGRVYRLGLKQSEDMFRIVNDEFCIRLYGRDYFVFELNRVT